MVFHLYGNSYATCTERVATILTEKNVPFVFHNIDLSKKEHKDSEYMKQQPFGQIPYIDDDGFILFESRAICRYIIDKYATQGTPNLIPSRTDLKAHALFEQAASIEQNNFGPQATEAAFEKLVKPRLGMKVDEARYQELVDTLDAKLAAYDVILGKHRYLAGDELTVADLFHLPNGTELANVMGHDLLTKRPNVARWWKELTERESWIKIKADGIVSTA